MNYKHSVYLCGPMNGLTVQQAKNGWRKMATDLLTELGIEALCPVRDHLAHLPEDHVLGGTGESQDPESMIAGRFNFRRDKSDVRRCSALLAVFIDTTRVSLGSVSEIAWADLLSIPIVVVRCNDIYHDHLFVNEAASAITDDLERGVSLIGSLLNA